MFELIVLEEAREYLKSLSPAVRKKIAYNIRKVKGGIKDLNFSRNLKIRIFGSFEPYIWVLLTDFSHFGIQKHKLLWSQLMAL